MTSSALELLEYPCRFPLKVVGKKTESFETHVIELVKQHLPDPHSVEISINASRNQRYLSITLTFEAHSQTQLETIYRVLYESPQVTMTL